jgi:hypothetical protein
VLFNHIKLKISLTSSATTGNYCPMETVVKNANTIENPTETKKIQGDHIAGEFSATGDHTGAASNITKDQGADLMEAIEKSPPLQPLDTTGDAATPRVEAPAASSTEQVVFDQSEDAAIASQTDGEPTGEADDPVWLSPDLRALFVDPKEQPELPVKFGEPTHISEKGGEQIGETEDDTPIAPDLGLIESPDHKAEFPGEEAVRIELQNLKGSVKGKRNLEKEYLKYFLFPISNNWHRSVDRILALSQWCDSAQKHLDDAQLKKLQGLMQFGKSTFSKLCKIGESRRVRDNVRSLPPSYSILYEVANLSDSVWKTMVEKGLINRDLTRATITEFKKTPDQPEPPKSEPEESEGADDPVEAADGRAKGRLFASIVVTDDELSEATLALLRQKLNKLKEIAGVSVEYKDA